MMQTELLNQLTRFVRARHDDMLPVVDVLERIAHGTTGAQHDATFALAYLARRYNLHPDFDPRWDLTA